MAKSAERKTRVTTVAVDDFIDSLDREQVRDDCRTIAAIMQKATKANTARIGASPTPASCVNTSGARTSRFFTHWCGRIA